MKRYTDTKLDKLLRIHHGMVDNIINQACEDLEAGKPKPEEETFIWMPIDRYKADYRLKGRMQDCRPTAGAAMQGSTYRGVQSWLNGLD